MAQTHAVVLGVDSSTQSTKVVAVDIETGQVVSEGRAPHTGADTQDPTDWWSALETAVHVAVSDNLEVRGIAIGGQQHGFVALDAAGEPIRPAPLWNNVAAAPDAEHLNGLTDFAAEVGTRLVASITIAKVAHLTRTAPAELSRIARICLPHDYLNWRLTGVLATDRSEASGSGWWSPSTGEIRRDLLSLAAGEDFAARVQLPEVRAASEIAGQLSLSAATALGLPAGIPVGPGAGDNAAAAVGIGATADELVISLGTSGVAFAVSELPTADPSGEVCGFADATDRFLPLACMINCTRVVGVQAELFGLTVTEALDRAADIDPGADGLLLMPFLGGERTPNLPNATGSLYGVTALNVRPELLVRAAVDGVAAGLAYCATALARQSVRKPNVTLVGGGSRHRAWQQAIADATGLPVTVRGGGEHVAHGAAVQIAAILSNVPVADLATAWRPEIIAEAQPRSEFRVAFREEDRLAIIDQMKAQAAV